MKINKVNAIKLVIILALLQASVLFSQTPSEHYEWRIVDNLKEIIQKFPLYDSNKVWMEIEMPIDSIGKKIHWSFPQYQIPQAKIYTRDSITLWIGQNPIMGLIILKSNDYGENWELLYSEVLDTNFKIGMQPPYPASSKDKIINQTFWVDSNKFIMPRLGDIFYSNLSDTNVFIKYPNPNPDDEHSFFETELNTFSVGKDCKIFALYTYSENWQPYKTTRYIITSDNFGQSWDTINVATGYNWSSYRASILPLDKNGDPWDNYNSLFVARQTASADPQHTFMKNRGTNQPQMLFNLEEFEKYSVINNFFQQYYDDRDSICYFLFHKNSASGNALHREVKIIKFEKNSSDFGYMQTVMSDGLLCYMDIKHISFDSTKQYGVLAASPIHNYGYDYTKFYLTVDSGKTWNVDLVSDSDFNGASDVLGHHKHHQELLSLWI